MARSILPFVHLQKLFHYFNKCNGACERNEGCFRWSPLPLSRTFVRIGPPQVCRRPIRPRRQPAEKQQTIERGERRDENVEAI